MRLIDSVSKADVLETYAELYDVFDDYKGIKNELHKVYDKLNALPSAQPERKRGKWVEHTDTRFGIKLNDCIECNCCRVWFSANEMKRRSFCPNCGADMRGENNG